MQKKNRRRDAGATKSADSIRCISSIRSAARSEG
jgi:hypothetical protein